MFVCIYIHILNKALCCIVCCICGKNIDFKIRRDHGKNSYKRPVYESVDDSFYLVIFQ